MTDEWQGWLHEFPSREAVEAHVAASPPPPYASAWATGAPWMRVGGCGDLVVIYLAVIDGEVRERFGGDAAWHAMEMGRAGMWRPITALGEETGVRAAGPIIEALDAAAVRLARERDDATGSAARLRDELREAKAIINGRATAPTDAEIAAHAQLTFAAELLGRHAASDVAVPVLVHLTRHGDAIVREGALRGLRYHVADTRAVAALRAMRDDVVLELRLMATRAT